MASISTEQMRVPSAFDALQAMGHEERRDLVAAYDLLMPSIILEQEEFPRWDVFVDAS